MAGEHRPTRLLNPLTCTCSNPRPLIDSDGRAFAVLAGQPNDPTYAEDCERAYDAITGEGNAANFQRKEGRGRRGDFAGVTVGVSHGKGTTEPVNLQHPIRREMLDRLLANQSIKRLAAFHSGEQFFDSCSAAANILPASFQLWAPNTYRYFQDNLEQLWQTHPHLNRNFAKSVFPCATFNFGPNVWTFKHRDVLNCPFGWCAVQALGNFDHRRSGHMILWELKLIIEFPSGSTILIPSATITHSNIPIAEGDARASFTQFCAGGLFRYVDNGFRTEKALAEQDPEEYQRILSLKETRWQMGLGLFSTINELLAPLGTS